MSKEAVIIQEFNEKERKYEYFVKGFDVTKSVKILLKRHKEEYDKEKNIFAGTQGFIEAQQLYEKQISDLEAKLAESEKNVEFYQERYSNATTSAYGADLIAKNTQSRLEEEIRELKQQLVEKEKENKKLMLAHFESEGNKPVLTTTEIINQDKISFAVEKLEKVKEWCENWKCYTENINYVIVEEKNGIRCNPTLYEEIDNQIKQLKEKK